MPAVPGLQLRRTPRTGSQVVQRGLLPTPLFHRTQARHVLLCTRLPCVQGLAYADLMKLRRVAHQQTPRSRPAPHSPQGWHPHPPGTSSKPGTGGAKGGTRPGSPVPAIPGMNPRGSMAPRPGSPEIPPSSRGQLMSPAQRLQGRAWDMDNGLTPQHHSNA